METFMKMWSGEEGIKLERETMVAVAKAYAKAGSTKKAIEMYGGVSGSKREVYRLRNECKKNEKLENDGCKTVIGSLLKLDDVEGAEKVYGEWKPVGPKLDLSIPGLLISRFCAEGNELKVGELISSIGKKRNGMHLRMEMAFIARVVKGVAIDAAVFGPIFQRASRDELVRVWARSGMGSVYPAGRAGIRTDIVTLTLEL
ncbi:hypothetical protein F2Q68_00012581 [Brassica cretica]|uniref:Uncharacterized protein n=1 Tax=Brassica cretica TaxID=69181 RepID=A0A8S9KSW8_BRACR|nr:hypothetical protein F2Q68_00012581 [Brassica cretica]